MWYTTLEFYYWSSSWVAAFSIWKVTLSLMSTRMKPILPGICFPNALHELPQRSTMTLCSSRCTQSTPAVHPHPCNHDLTDQQPPLSLTPLRQDPGLRGHRVAGPWPGATELSIPLRGQKRLHRTAVLSSAANKCSPWWITEVTFSNEIKPNWKK